MYLALQGLLRHWLLWWCAAWCALWCMLYVPQLGAAVPSNVVIDAPAPLRDLLRTYLSLPTSEELSAAALVNLPEKAREQAAELLATEGYFSATFKLARDPMNSDATALRLMVEAGPRSVIDRVEIEFIGDISTPNAASKTNNAREFERQQRIKNLIDNWQLSKGKPFRQADWDNAKRTLLQNLAANDYPAAKIIQSLSEVDRDAARVNINIVIDSDRAYVLGEFIVEGLQTYDRQLIDRYNFLLRGERYSQQRLLELQRALQNTPFFSSVLVDVNLDYDPTAPALASEGLAAPVQASAQLPVPVSVRIRVSEAKPKRVSVSAGFSTNNGARGEITYRDANFFGRAWLLATGLRADSVEQLAYADITLPPTPKGYRDSFGVLAARADNQGLLTRRQGIGAARLQNRGIIETRLSLNFQSEQRNVDAADADSNATRKALALNYSWTWRNVDNVLDPRQGLVVNAQIGGAARALLSDENFVRGSVKLQQYWPVFSGDIFTVRMEAGMTAAQSRIGIPEEYLFRAGGAQSVRGYGYQSIGIREGNAVVGGRFLITGTAEYVHWLNPKWGAAVFYDVGRVADSTKNFFPLLSGVGAGARWRSPAGPLAFDLAYSVRDRKLRPVFSIAVAF